MAELTLQYRASISDVVSYEAAAAAGNEFSNRNGRSRLFLRNVGGTAVRVRVQRWRANSDGLLDDWEFSLPAGGANIELAELNPYAWNEPGTGLVHVTYPDGATSIQVAAEGRS